MSSESSFSPATDQPATSTTSRLNSWKEIATYFARDIRTVQLWEKMETLPIHRHEHGARSSVYAYPEELDSWLRNRRQDKITTTLHEKPPVVLSFFRKAPLVWFAIALLVPALATISYFILSHQSVDPLIGNRQTLAVLPFEDLSTNSADNRWADSLTDDLITSLGKYDRVHVVSRRSVMQFKATHEPLPQIARQLRVSLMIEGTVIQDNGRIRVTTRLLDAVADHQIWACSYTNTTDDILSLQDDIARDLAEKVLQTLSSTGSASKTWTPTKTLGMDCST